MLRGEQVFVAKETGVDLESAFDCVAPGDSAVISNGITTKHTKITKTEITKVRLLTDIQLVDIEILDFDDTGQQLFRSSNSSCPSRPSW